MSLGGNVLSTLMSAVRFSLHVLHIAVLRKRKEKNSCFASDCDSLLDILCSLCDSQYDIPSNHEYDASFVIKQEHFFPKIYKNLVSSRAQLY